MLLRWNGTRFLGGVDELTRPDAASGGQALPGMRSLSSIAVEATVGGEATLFLLSGVYAPLEERAAGSGGTPA